MPLPAKLRKRRPPAREVLPLHHSPASSGSFGFQKGRRRRKRSGRQSSLARSVLVGSSIALLGIFGFLRIWTFSTGESEQLHPSLVERMRKYRGNRWRSKNASKQKNQTRKRFQCADGTIGYLNDDYCDCSDGRDEVGTAACSHVLVQQEVFQCRDGSVAIFASHVGDGINDCPDGSDEVPR